MKKMKDYWKKLSRRIFPSLRLWDEIKEETISLKLNVDQLCFTIDQLYILAEISLAIIEETKNAEMGTD